MTKLNYVATLIGLLFVVVVVLPTYLIGLNYVLLMFKLVIVGSITAILAGSCYIIAEILMGDE